MTPEAVQKLLDDELKAVSLAIGTAMTARGIRPGEPYRVIDERRDWSARRDSPDHPGGPAELWGPTA